MSMKQIDCYGFETTSEYFKLKKPDAHLVKIKDGVMYRILGDSNCNFFCGVLKVPFGAARANF